MRTCIHCGNEFDENLGNCEHCAMPSNFPNVYSANRPEETKAIEDSYSSSVATVAGFDSAASAVLERFASVVSDKSVAIVVRPLSEVGVLFDRPNALHMTFHKRLRAGGCRFDGGAYDPLRISIDSKLFPNYFEEITFAALSLEHTGAGLKYGECHMTLRTSLIEYRTSLFVGNSFHIIKELEHGVPIPFGLRTVWESRGKLAAIRNAKKISCATTESEFPGILNDGDDDFVEAHVYGSISQKTIERVAVNQAALAGSRKTFAAALRERFDELKASESNWSVMFQEI